MRRNRDVGGLLAALDNPSPAVRVAAVAALGHVGGQRATRALVAALGDPDPHVREHAARALGCNHHSSLGCHRSEAREPLEAALADRDAFVRLEAVRALGELRDPEARSAIERLVRAERDPTVRRVAVLALGRLGDRRARPLLEELAASGPERIRSAAAEALEGLELARRLTPEGVEDGPDAGEEPSPAEPEDVADAEPGP